MIIKCNDNSVFIISTKTSSTKFYGDVRRHMKKDGDAFFSAPKNWRDMVSYIQKNLVTQQSILR